MNKPEPWCTDEMTLSVYLQLGFGYKSGNKKPGFGFELEVYNNCESKYTGGRGRCIFVRIAHNKTK